MKADLRQRFLINMIFKIPDITLQLQLTATND